LYVSNPLINLQILNNAQNIFWCVLPLLILFWIQARNSKNKISFLYKIIKISLIISLLISSSSAVNCVIFFISILSIESLIFFQRKDFRLYLKLNFYILITIILIILLNTPFFVSFFLIPYDLNDANKMTDF